MTEFALLDHVGHTLVLDVGAVREVETRRYGRKRVIECPVVLDDDCGLYTDVLLWQAAVVAQLAPQQHQTVLVGVGTYESKYGQVGVKLVAP